MKRQRLPYISLFTYLSMLVKNDFQDIIRLRATLFFQPHTQFMFLILERHIPPILQKDNTNRTSVKTNTDF